MPTMFWRFVNGPWPAILGLCLGVLSMPGMLEDATAWWGLLAKVPPQFRSLSSPDRTRWPRAGTV